LKWSAQQVREDLQQAGRCKVTGELENVIFQCIATDTRDLTQGSLFVALRGEQFDAHRFLTQAVEQGALGLIVDRPVDTLGTDATPIVFEVEDTLKALQALAAGSLRRYPVQGIAITGSNGKTTTKDLTAQALGTLGSVHATRGNRNNHIGVPLTLLERTGEERFLVTEMGANDFGEIALLSRLLGPQVAVVTNIGRAHLERFGSEDGVARAKAEVFEGLPSDGLAVLNADDSRTPQLLESLDDQRFVQFGFAAHADYRIESSSNTAAGGQRLTVNGQTLELARAGSGNAQNAAAAFAVACELGADAAVVARALEQTQFTGQRSLWVALGDVIVLDDTYNANPDSMFEALSLLQSRPERRIAVLGEMLELGEQAGELHESIGRGAYDANVAVLLGYGEQMSHTVRAAVAAGVPHAQHFTSMPQLLECLQENLKPGDAVLVKGSRGCRMERVVEALKAEVV
jgi:UDP-N-acetylmuramoyl-tripeptide--D-alanyl-D-alanine ligase